VLTQFAAMSEGFEGGVFWSIAMTFSVSKQVEVYVFVAASKQPVPGALLMTVMPMGQEGMFTP
jgi:hypothetical protein